MNYKNCEKALTRLAIPYMAKIDYQDIYHECNEGEYAHELNSRNS